MPPKRRGAGRRGSGGGGSASGSGSGSGSSSAAASGSAASGATTGTTADADAGAGGGGGDHHSGTDAASAPKSGRYPSTPHLPFSPEVHDDDTQLRDTDASAFVGVPIVVTEKCDGGNCCIRDGKVFARTHGHEATHESFGPIKELAARVTMSAAVEEGAALFGENMFAIHSIEYDDLESHFYLFAVKRSDGTFLAWDRVVETAEMLGVPTAPVVFTGEVSSLAELQRLMDERAGLRSGLAHSDDTKPEGFVVRVAGEFGDGRFDRCMAKYVRKGHLQTRPGWPRTWYKATLHGWRKAGGKGKGK